MRSLLRETAVIDEAIELRLKNDIAEVPRLAEIVDEFCARHDLTPEIVNKFHLAVDEALTNIISYACGDDKEHEIAVRLAIADGAMTAELADDGRPFDPLQLKPPDVGLSIEEREVGGLGVYFIGSLMDDVRYWHDGQRNHLAFSKRIGGEADTAVG